ncbi:alpha/beta hydrolase [Uliginosibacterium sp. H3]|uniref:Alpha/beta hydrolase n=1 Tax=Uliginosibacterium silvisoli TaxID=3114758 RepID=A0ABU6JXA1_9RHOO|nr:alpha/beta hydrolase [Uliginosibacterium sp. H3]
MPQQFSRRSALWLKLARQRLGGRHARGGKRLLYLCFAAAGTLLSACGFLPQPHTVPLPALHDRLSPAAPAKRLVVMLPGIYDKAADFVSEGFVKDLRSRGIDADVLMPEAHFGYYEARDVDLRLEQDIFAPARAQGYREIWIVGVSLGGLGALLYSSQHAESITGILLIAPFPGTDKVLGEIRQAGGLRSWSATPQAQMGDERPALRWFASAASLQQQKPASVPGIFLATGKADRLFEGQRLLSEALPPAHVQLVEGGHDWQTWRHLWQEFLDEGPWALEAAKRAHLDRIRL